MKTKEPTLEDIFGRKYEPKLIELAGTKSRSPKIYTILLNERFGTEYDDKEINKYCITHFGRTYSEYLKYLKAISRAKKGNGSHQGENKDFSKSLNSMGCKSGKINHSGATHRKDVGTF